MMMRIHKESNPKNHIYMLLTLRKPKIKMFFYPLKPLIINKQEP